MVDRQEKMLNGILFFTFFKLHMPTKSWAESSLAQNHYMAGRQTLSDF